MKKYKVFIPSAGLGTRLGLLSENLNKALIAVNNKPAISYVIEKFSKDIEFVIALGYKGSLVRDYLELAHFDRKIQFVDIDPFEGPGSGLGRTILECKSFLQCPFIFCPNDTIVIEDISPPTQNWVAYDEIENDGSYRSLKIGLNNQIIKICEKDDIYAQGSKPYTGLAGIKDYKDFWSFMEKGRVYGSIQIGESYALRKFIEKEIPVEGRKVTWYDTGTPSRLAKTRSAMASKNAPQILEKSNEAIWFVNEHVIKYNTDTQFILDRVERSQLLEGLVPPIVDSRSNMYSYRFINGTTLSKNNTNTTFKNFLDYLERLWTPKKLDLKRAQQFNTVSYDFYKTKTEKRIQLYFDKLSQKDNIETINGQKVPPLKEVLETLDWDWLCTGVPVRIHGDLHFENVVVAETGEFYLLDWRQNFGSIKDYGDLYYDLAKLLHGLIVSHELINKEHFEIDQQNDIISFDLHRKYSLIENETMFLKYLEDKNLDSHKVKVLTALIFLNIAPLHHSPYNKMLFYLGKTQLYNLLKEEQ